MTTFDSAIELFPIFRERVWGRESLAPFFPDHPRKERIGEVWFTFEENFTSARLKLGELLRDHSDLLGTAFDLRYPGICPILVKLLFTSERLSVQVHPDDAYAQQHHDSLGKTEAWYVLDVQPPGELAVGFKEPITPERLQSSAESGEIEQLLNWRIARRGETIFTPAGTVHAIGAGLTICEIQENSDITYRLYDYGRPRELHLEHGARVSSLGPHEYEANPVSLAAGRDELVACEYFRIERIRPAERFKIPGNMLSYAIVICVDGGGTLCDTKACQGQAWFIPAGAEAVPVDAPGSEWIVTYLAEEPMLGLQVE
ncbi:MAG: class I mannose-6-phosphate isomerase [Acidobacteriaceae bacterium]|nr:class I mannose-6-phosphate isomerase [Acidobacteriaceae bacterium]